MKKKNVIKRILLERIKNKPCLLSKLYNNLMIKKKRNTLKKKWASTTDSQKNTALEFSFSSGTMNDNVQDIGHSSNLDPRATNESHPSLPSALDEM